MAMNNSKITISSFVKFVFPSVLILLFVSVYSSIDSLFIARLIGSTALAGQGIAFPLYSIAFAIGIMFATGGGALIAIKAGQNDYAGARKSFSSLLTVGILFGLISTLICIFNLESIIRFLGAKQELVTYASSYGLYLILAYPILIAQLLFETILKINNRPMISLYINITGGIANIIFDYIFIVYFKMGISGAGLGTFLGIALAMILGCIFTSGKKSKIHYILSFPDFSIIKNSILNGSSEMVNEIAVSLTTIVMNILAIKYYGDNGVATITILMTLIFAGTSIHIGFAMGTAPLISFNYGAENKVNISQIIKYSKLFLLVSSLFMAVALYSFAGKLIISLFVDAANPVYELALNVLKYIVPGFLFVGFNIFSSALFTAFNNGKISALISFAKSYVFFLLCAWIIPEIFGKNGIWLIIPTSEFLAFILTFFLVMKYQKKYHYTIFK